MAAIHSTAGRPARFRRRLLWLLLAIPALLGLAAWWFTAPLDDQPTDPPSNPSDSDVLAPKSVQTERLPAWPSGVLKGDEAKTLLLASARIATARIAQVEAYTATFRKQERLGGKLGPENTLKMKVRNRPFAIYLKFLAPKPGKEVVYAEGHHDNKVIAHNGDWTRKLVPRLAVAPDSALALADSRHPVTEAGLVHLANKLLAFRQKDIGDPHAQTTLDRYTDTEGRLWLRSIHTHSVNDGSRPFTKVEILYDASTQFPLRIASYDWPAPGQTGELELAERYAYDDLNLDPHLTPADFDPANPEYAFMRY
jgi:hypothetical protein